MHSAWPWPVAPHHDGSARYLSPPHPQLGEVVTAWVRTPPEVTGVMARYIHDGEPRFETARHDRAAAEQVWWRVDIEARNPVTAYRFLLDTPAGPRWLNQLGVFAHDVPDATDFRLMAGDPPPDWIHDAAVYQIFPDRFARSEAAGGHALPDWAIACDWDTPVIGRGPETPYQFYGGDLDGIASRLDYLADLGINTVYLTPIFPARSNHRYDASTFAAVDPLLGGDAALTRLAGAVHQRGWRLLGDLTTNHCGDAHEWFAAASGSVDAPEREMFYFDQTGDYESWLGVKSLPKLNWASTLLRERFCTGADAILARWLRPPYELDGWRVDVANMTGRRAGDDFAHEVARLARATVTGARPDALLVAEHAHDATGDLDRGGWHGTMNYAGFSRPVWSWLRAGDLPYEGVLGVPGQMPPCDGITAATTMRTFAAHMSWQSLSSSWNLLGSHDTPRIRTVVGDADRVEVAAGLLLSLPGVPMIFAGDELGLQGVNGEDSRTPMPWHRPQVWDRRIRECYQRLLALRSVQPALRRGGLRWLHADRDCLVFARETDRDLLLVQARRASGAPPHLPGLPPATNLYGGAADLVPDGAGRVRLPADGPTFQVWHAGG